MVLKCFYENKSISVLLKGKKIRKKSFLTKKFERFFVMELKVFFEVSSHFGIFWSKAKKNWDKKFFLFFLTFNKKILSSINQIVLISLWSGSFNSPFSK